MFGWFKKTAPAPAPVAAMVARPLGIGLTNQNDVDHGLYRMGAIRRHIAERPITTQRRQEYLNEARVTTANLVVSGAITEVDADEIVNMIKAAPIHEDTPIG